MTTRDDTQGRSLVLVGFMASGKSTIGALLAERLDLAFIDTDREIERALGMSVADIFRETGEMCFRAAEQKTILRLLAGERQVIAAGGGAFLNPLIRSKLRATARTIWLDPPFEIIRARLARSFDRPLAAARSDKELRHLWEERRAAYADADLHITTALKDPARVVEEIIELLAAS